MNKWKTAARLISIVCAFTAQVSAQTLDAGITRQLDLRLQTDGVNSKHVVFCGREIGKESTPGHAFIVLGSEDAERRVCSVDAFGFYPSSTLEGFKSTLMSVPAKVADEFLQIGVKEGECRLSVRIDDESFQAVQNVMNQWKNKSYRAREQDCVSFVTAVGEILGLAIPNRGTMSLKTPARFVRDLAAGNPPENFITGVWESDDAIKRFRLRIKGQSCQWLERTREGKEFGIQVRCEGTPPDFVLQRNNDDAVLRFLGFQDTLRAEILSKSPGHSTLRIRRDGDTLKGVWKGLVATKDSKAHLKELQFRESEWNFKRLPK